MIYYFLPDSGIFGGVKVGCQFVDLLSRCGVRCAVVLPNGTAPSWIPGRAPILSESEAKKKALPKDWLMFTWPPDYERLKEWQGRMVCHCQGTDKRMHPIFADREIPILTCWQQSRDYVAQRFDRQASDVGISISESFFFGGGIKEDNRVAYMPRRGFSIVRRAMRLNPFLDFVAIDGLPESGVAGILKGAGIFLATAVGEQFGLPALEAMAAGCVVLSVPVKGGKEYLIDNNTCLCSEPQNMADRLKWIADTAQSEFRCVLRARAMAMAVLYHPVKQLRKLRALLQQELKWLT